MLLRSDSSFQFELIGFCEDYSVLTRHAYFPADQLGNRRYLFRGDHGCLCCLELLFLKTVQFWNLEPPFCPLRYRVVKDLRSDPREK